jgi:uncharacterized tellurite resistance protein B-like protein
VPPVLDLLRRYLAPASVVDPAVGDASSSLPAADPLRLAACALLVELARADGEFSEVERAHIGDILVREFQVTPPGARELMTAADESLREAVDLHQFTAVINARYGVAERGGLAELLWGVVDADGVLSQHEAALIRRMGGLLDLPPGALNAARARAAEHRKG